MTGAPVTLEVGVNQTVKSLLLLGCSAASTTQLRRVLSSAGWHVDSQAAADNVCPLDSSGYQVVVFAVDNGNPGQAAKMLKFCSAADSAAFLPVIQDATPDQVVRLIRLGICDVLLEPFSDGELIDTVERVARHRNLHRENLASSAQLEQTNKELKESLNILKMDQIAGRQVQKSLLPQVPLVHKDYIVTHKIIPSLYLSGDFVAYNLVFDRYILFYIADVSGHGASSAFVTILLRFILKRIIRKHVRNNDVSALLRAPEGFIEHVNRQLLATGLEKQVTMFAGSIDTETNILRYSVAAQMPMPLFIVDHDARFLPGKGKIIGLFEDVTWAVEEIVLPQRFQLVMVSDGLIERLPGGGLMAQEAYLQATLAAAPPEHQAMCAALGLDKITETADDVSILTICRGGQQ
jgi:serine phosphatase RsbU (regulator of sigma subunit)